MSDVPKRFFITGASSGFGHAFAAAALHKGHRVVGTVRSQADADRLSALFPYGRAHAELLDVTDDDAVSSAVERTEQTVGPIDVVIANAGYGHEGTIEESTMSDRRRQFAVNVFGALATLKAALPFMRQRRSGHLITMSSISGLRTVPGLGFYFGSKYALEGIVETLAKEVAHLGIHVTAVEPGLFRTDWAGRSMVRSRSELADYEEVFAPAHRARLAESGHQPGDPARAAEAVLELIGLECPPRHLLLGSDAVRLVSQSRAEVDAELYAFESLTRSTDFPDAVTPRPTAPEVSTRCLVRVMHASAGRGADGGGRRSVWPARMHESSSRQDVDTEAASTVRDGLLCPAARAVRWDAPTDQASGGQSVLGARAFARYAHVVAEASPVLVALHTDHCPPPHVDDWLQPLLAESRRRVERGATPLFHSHMFDGSTLPLDENLRIASALLARCSELDVILEVESGVVGGEEDGIVGPANGRDELYTTPSDLLRVADALGIGERGRYLVAATFGNVHGTYAPGNVVLRPEILQAGQQALAAAYPDARFQYVFHGSSGSSECELANAVSFGVVKVNVDTDNQYAFTRALAGHVLDHWQGVLKVDGGIGDKRSFDPRAWGGAGEAAMAGRVRQACEQLGSAGRSLAASAAASGRAGRRLIDLD